MNIQRECKEVNSWLAHRVSPLNMDLPLRVHNRAHECVSTGVFLYASVWKHGASENPARLMAYRIQSCKTALELNIFF